MSRSFLIISILSILLIVSLVANAAQYTTANELEDEVTRLKNKDEVYQTASSFVKSMMGGNIEKSQSKLKEMTTKNAQNKLFHSSDIQSDFIQTVEIEGIKIEHYKENEAKTNVIFLTHIPDDADIPSSEYRLRLMMKRAPDGWKIDDYQFHFGQNESEGVQ